MTKTDLVDNLSSLERFTFAARRLGIDITDQALDRFLIYERELLRWNEKINLVSLRSREDLWTRHFLDSLAPAPLMVNLSGRLLDIGAGGGFPGLPLAIAFPTLHLHLVESCRKKSSFLKEAIRALDLPGARVFNERIEKLQTDKGLRETFDTVISRAAFKLSELVRHGSVFLAPEGILIAMKGRGDLEPERQKADDLAYSLGLTIIREQKYTEPASDQTRSILVFKKIPSVLRTHRP